MKSILTPSRWCAILCALVLTTGCVGVQVQLTHAPAGSFDATKGRVITAEAAGFQLLLLIPIQTNSRQQRAYDALMAQATPNEVVTDIQVQEAWTYGLVGTVYRTRLKAMAYPKSAAP